MIRSWIGVFVSVAVAESSVSAQVTSRVSVGPAGAQANSSSDEGSVSTDGRFVSFVSSATNLVAGDTNGAVDIFVRDLQAGTTERVSVATGGAQGNSSSSEPFISADGRYVVFTSLATNLVAGDTNSVEDIFVRDRQLATTARVNLTGGGLQANDQSYTGSISADGRYVAFFSFATNLAAPGGAFLGDIYVRDRVGGTTELISVDSGGGQADQGGEYVQISADGNFVAFTSRSTDLVAGDTNGAVDIFVRDRVGASTERVSVDTTGTQANGASGVYPSISSDGRYVAFASSANNLVAGDTNGFPDIFVRDRQSNTTERISLDSGGAQATGNTADRPSLSADGRYVAFQSAATNLVVGDTNAMDDMFLRDRLTGRTERVSLDTLGNQANQASRFGTISGDGRFVAFRSGATNLVPGDTNGQFDIFLRERGGGTDPESVGLGGAPSNGPSNRVSISADDRYVVFESVATNLVTGDTNGARDIFVRDRDTATTTRVSVGAGGVQGNGDSSFPTISSDGRYVAFESLATNLVAADTNGVADVFMHDRQTGTTTRVSVTSGGAEGNGASTHPAISGDGSIVAFDSVATNLVAGDTNGVMDVFARDGLTSLVSATTRMSVDTGGAQSDGASAKAAISANGAIVVFESTASNLVAGDSNALLDVFWRDRSVAATGTGRVSVGTGGIQGAGPSRAPSISGDGRFVAFASDASNIVAGDSNLTMDVFVRDRQLASTVRVSVDGGGTQGAMSSDDPWITTDGRFVAFASDSDNLVGGDTNLTMDVFVHDRVLSTTERISVDSGGTQGAMSSGRPSISADGRHVAFESDAANLVIGDTNGFTDVFVHDLGVASSFEAFCFGDGTTGHCPCGNFGTSGHGCQNSAGTGGALLTVTGVASLSADTVQFTSSGETTTAFNPVQKRGLSILMQGSGAIAPIHYGDGLRCTGGDLKRLYTKLSVGGVSIAPQAGDLSISARSAQLSAPIPLGATRPYQVYYRDGVASFCATPTGDSFNMSNGFLVAWGS